MWHTLRPLRCQARGLLHRYVPRLHQRLSFTVNRSCLSVPFTALLSFRQRDPESLTPRVLTLGPGLVPLLVDLCRFSSTAFRWSSSCRLVLPRLAFLVCLRLLSRSPAFVVLTCAFRPNGAQRRWIGWIVLPWIDGWGEPIQPIVGLAP